jgi:DNA repair exonuclease SbcCD ATPase subunit
MGNHESVSAEKIANLEQRLNAIDANRDGAISKNELHTWLAMTEASIEQKYLNILKEKTDLLKAANTEIEDLKKQMESLLIIHRELEEKNITVHQQIRAVHSSDNKVVELSHQRIDEWVDEILSNKQMNIKYLPDFVERQIYRNTLNMAINLLDRFVNSIHIKFLGHELVADIQPISAEQNKNLNIDNVNTDDHESD